MMKIRRLFLSLLLAVFVSNVRPRAHAATITVNTLVDESDGSCTDGDCSLRDAIAVANAGDTINFSVTGTLVVTNYSFMSIPKNLTISGPGAGSLSIRRDIDTVIFYLASGIHATISSLTISGRGGGIYTDWGSTLTVRNSTFSGNSGRGAIQSHGTLTVANCIFSGNSATLGGAIESRGTLTVTNCTFSNNSANMDGGAIENWGGTLTVNNSTFSGNSATSDGGAINNDGTLTVVNSLFSSNSAGRWGGGIEIFAGTVTMTNTIFSGNSTGSRGGGIDNWGRLSVTSSTFSGNSAGDGGGIASFGPVNVTSTTFAGNSASQWGGGIHSSGTLNVTNSTFSGNSAGDEGGGIHIGGTLNVVNSTFSGNSASEGGGLQSIGTVTLKNTIIANSTAGGNCYRYSYFTGGSTNNLSTDDSCSSGFTQTTASALKLNWQGWVFALLPGSVAIDAGTNTACPATDQRGWPRPQDGNGDGVAICDVGSYELAPLTRELRLPLILK